MTFKPVSMVVTTEKNFFEAEERSLKKIDSTCNIGSLLNSLLKTSNYNWRRNGVQFISLRTSFAMVYRRSTYICLEKWKHQRK